MRANFPVHPQGRHDDSRSADTSREFLALAWLSEDGTILETNDVFQKTLGRDISKLSRAEQAKAIGDPGFYELVNGLSRVPTAQSEIQLRTGDGQVLWLQVSLVSQVSLKGDILMIAQDITDTRRKNRSAHWKLEALSQTRLVAEMDLSGRLVSANGHFKKAVGLPENRLEEFLLNNMATENFFEDITCEEAWRKLCLGATISGDFRFRRENGGDLWLRGSFDPVACDDDSIGTILFMGQDITQATQEKIDQDGQMRALSRAQAVVEFALDGTVLTANSNFLDLFDYELGQVQGQHHRMFVPPEDAATAAYAEFWNRLGQGEFQTAEFKRIGRNGKEIWIHASYNPIFDPFGHPIKIVKFASDITNRKNAETLGIRAQVESAKEAMRETEAQFRATIDVAPVGMALLDEDCRMLHVNAALAQFSGYSVEELLSMRLADLIPPARRVISEAQRELLKTGQMKLIQMERRVLRKDGTEGYALLHISEQRSANSERIEFIVQIQDITERRMMDQIKSDFVATVSHELRTPLTSIQGALKLLPLPIAKGDQAGAQKLLDIASKNGDRLMRLVSDLLEAEKFSSADMPLCLGAEKVLPQLEHAIQMNTPYGEQLDVSFLLDEVDADLMIRIDPARFQQVMSNLLSNAAKFSPKGEVVRLGCEEREGMICVTVTDQGCGIPESFREKIFEPFTQVDNSATRHVGGTGLGLNITRLLVERMEGSIGFENLAPRGCQFGVMLPKALS